MLDAIETAAAFVGLTLFALAGAAFVLVFTAIAVAGTIILAVVALPIRLAQALRGQPKKPLSTK